MSQLREDMDTLLEATGKKPKKAKKPISNTRWAIRKAIEYFKPIVKKPKR